MLDRVPAWLRHLVFALAPALLGWLASDLVPMLNDRGGMAATGAAVLTMLLAVLTPLTRQYGVGASTEDGA